MEIRINLNDEKSIDQAIKQVTEYKKSLASKLTEIRKRVGQELRDEIYKGYNGADYNYIHLEGFQIPNVDVGIDNTDGQLTVVFTEESMAAWVIEFGAGVYFNPGGTPNPLRPEGLVPIGKWGKGRGSRPIWGYYETPGDKNSLKLTHGTPASMPIYNAVQKILPRINIIAREVFGGGSG